MQLWGSVFMLGLVLLVGGGIKLVSKIGLVAFGVALLGIATVLAAGCESAYYGAMEKVGFHKRDILVDRVEAAADSQQEAKEEFENAFEQFASVVEVPLKRSQGVKGLFTRDQSERYDAVIDMMAEIRDEAGNVRVTVESTATRSRSVSENISLIEREKVWFEMTESMMTDLNTALENQIRIHMKDWIR